MVAPPGGHEGRWERQAQHAALLVEPVVLERAQPALKGAAAELLAQPRAYLRPDLLDLFAKVHIAPGRKSDFLHWSISGFILIERRVRPHPIHPLLQMGQEWSWRLPGIVQNLPRLLRSEEHTSELQSLMRISYAVFCLKKKTTTKQ